ncbi:MAG: hypothetical protein Kow0068_24120 [Marinilabiliales bacterium]
MGKNGLLIIILTAIIISACEIINPSEDIPAYIYIEKFDLVTTSIQGSDNHNITDAWVYINGDEAGTYELPVTFPVLASGKCSVLIRAGIKHNGISNDRVIYPFYKKYEVNIDLEPKKIDTIHPVVYYLDELKFSDLWMADFEDAGLPLDTTPSSNVNLLQVTDTITNSKVGEIFITEDKPNFYCVSDPIELPVDGSVIYLEMDYRCNQSFSLGMIANLGTTTSSQQVFIFNSTDGQWNKIYIDLTYYTVDNPLAQSFSLFFSANKDDNVATGNIALDNLKLLHL